MPEFGGLGGWFEGSSWGELCHDNDVRIKGTYSNVLEGLKSSLKGGGYLISFASTSLIGSRYGSTKFHTCRTRYPTHSCFQKNVDQVARPGFKQVQGLKGRLETSNTD